MMRSLELRATFGRAREKDIGRVHELLDRTNQFNTTTRRRSESELRALAGGEGHSIYVATLADKFGDLGLVGVVIVERSGSDIAFDSVVMSCRAMGFGLEYLMLRAALDAETPWRRAVGRYAPSARNDPCAGLFASAGFHEQGEAEWILEATDRAPAAPDWLSMSRH
jgi:FkbH-like protein